MKLGRTEDGGENTPATSTVKRKGDEARGRDNGHAHIKASGIPNDVGCGEKKLKAGRHPLRNQAEGTHPILSSPNIHLRTSAAPTVSRARSRNRAQVAPPASRRVWLAARTQDFIFTNSLLKAHFSADPCSPIPRDAYIQSQGSPQSGSIPSARRDPSGAALCAHSVGHHSSMLEARIVPCRPGSTTRRNSPRRSVNRLRDPEDSAAEVFLIHCTMTVFASVMSEWAITDRPSVVAGLDSSTARDEPHVETPCGISNLFSPKILSTPECYPSRKSNTLFPVCRRMT
ncbi:hypothetical protein AG1IA_09452 [Rhizoctonia solani AG-1 IA]|uniref:Uncharacterized protein n=1 Tax=Thanatephorus cucumeris (strain AG1-IA) TaxID=983506 RepID=L8WJG7_THACA|nr:hypothetical protein AG1IA_09452 [Rhizoctonia solani AG-1 IA]